MAIAKKRSWMSYAYGYQNHSQSSKQRKYYMQNARGDVAQLAGAGGNVMKVYTYEAFGVETDVL